jgi:hypothetical protein
MIENFISMLQVNFFVWVNVTSKILFSDIKRFMRKENFPKEDGEKKISHECENKFMYIIN